MGSVGVGVLLNPIAGFGGTLALHGTDELPSERFTEALAAGYSAGRLLRAIAELRRSGAELELLAAPGLLGAAQLTAAEVPHRVLNTGTTGDPERSARADTLAAASAFATARIDALLFAGGDGTATDVAAAFGTGRPVVGVPSGVKMHSEVFARSPERAGRLLAEHLKGVGTTELVEVLDVGPDDRTGVVAMLRAPRVSEPLQGAKSTVGVSHGDAAARAVARVLIAEAGTDATWVIGPGTTTGMLAGELGFAPTLRGVDVRHRSGRIELDLDERGLFRAIQEAQDPHLAIGVVGGQGFLLGRGNQEISTRVLESIGVERVHVVATEEKVRGLFPPVLLIDTDDGHGRGGSHPLVGYRRVRTGPRQNLMMRVINVAA